MSIHNSVSDVEDTGHSCFVSFGSVVCVCVCWPECSLSCTSTLGVSRVKIVFQIHLKPFFPGWRTRSAGAFESHFISEKSF